MTYASFETSGESGQPLELYLFKLSGLEFPYNNGEIDREYDSRTYVTESISRGRISAEADKSGQQLEISMPITNEFAALYLGIPPGERSSVEIFQVHLQDTPGFQLVQVFDGLISTVSYGKSGKRATVIARPRTSAGERPLPRRTYQGLCNHVLYDQRCALNEVDFEENAQVTAVNGQVLSTLGLTNIGGGADYWEAGYVEFGTERRLIVAQSTNDLTINIEFKESPLNETLRFLPGCKLRRITDCDTKFSNVINFGGFSYVPLKNPFEAGLD